MNYRGECGRVGWAGWSEGGEWDNCNSIMNKYIFLKKTWRPLSCLTVLLPKQFPKHLPRLLLSFHNIGISCKLANVYCLPFNKHWILHGHYFQELPVKQWSPTCHGASDPWIQLQVQFLSPTLTRHTPLRVNRNGEQRTKACDCEDQEIKRELPRFCHLGGHHCKFLFGFTISHSKIVQGVIFLFGKGKF